MSDRTQHIHLETEPSDQLLPKPDVSLMERLKEWAGEITDPPIPANDDDTRDEPVTGKGRTP